MNNKKLLVLDTSFTFQTIKFRGLETSVTCRDLDGYFAHVWSVHPFASLVSSREWGPEFGRPKFYKISESHTFIEGKVGYSEIFRKIPIINFLLSQIDVFFVLYKLIRKERISVIRVGDPLYLGMLGWLLSRTTRIPFVVRVGANNDKIRETTGLRMMPRFFKSMNQERRTERFVLSRADLVAGANLDNLKFAISCGAKENRCTLFRYGNLIDPLHFTEPFTRKKIDSIPLEKPFILCIARLETVKKVDDTIRVLAEVIKRGFDLNLFLVGDGRERKNIEDLANQLGVLNNVVFWGSRDQSWLSSVIPLASVVLSPHTGRALTEAGLGGIPIVAYDVDWQSELIKTGQTGELVEYGDWLAFAEATIKILKDAKYAQKIAKNLREFVMDMMNPKKLNQHEIDQYEKLIFRK